tara:strand:- start:64 stop:1218 length:1155 start_codon:yes stop_codon:yes gene_type:complete
MGCASKAFFKKLQRKLDEIKDFFSEENIQRIQDEITAFIDEMVGNFQRLTLENVLLMMYQLCRFTETLQAILMGDANEVQRISAVAIQETAALENAGLKATKKAVKNGAIRVAPGDRLKKREEVIKKNNEEAKASPAETDYITDPCPTQAEIEAINKISATGLGDSITFSSSVVSNKEWEDVHISVWSKLLRIVEQTGDKYQVTDGVKKDTITTATMGGTSNHIHLTGFAVDIAVSDANREETVKAASRAGFSGIGVYKSFLHLDVGSRRSWVAGDKGIDISPTEKFRDNDLSSWIEIMDKHDMDGYRKKRGEEIVDTIDALSLDVSIDLTTKINADQAKLAESRAQEAEELQRDVDLTFNAQGLKSIRQMTQDERDSGEPVPL